MRRLLIAIALVAASPAAASAGLTPLATRIVTPVGAVYTGPVGAIAADAFDPLDVTIDWGDGSAATAGSATCTDCADGRALESITGTHTYAHPGRYRLVALVQDLGTGTRAQIVSTAIAQARPHPRARLVGPRHARPGTRVRWRLPVKLAPFAHRRFTFWTFGGASNALHGLGHGIFVRGRGVTRGSAISGRLPHAGKNRFAAQVIDDLGGSLHVVLDIAGLTATTPTAPPRAGFQFYDFPDQGEVVDFSGDFSDPGLPDDTLAYHWDFGDGVTADSTNPNAHHVYALGGRYTVRLTVSDGNGSDTIADAVTVVGKKLCDSVKLHGIRAYFPGCLLPMTTDADGNLAYQLSSASPLAINGIFFRPLSAAAPIVVKPATGTVWSAVTLERPVCPTNKKCPFIGISGGFTVPAPNAAGESVVSEGINASLVGTIAGFALAGTATVHLFANPQLDAVYEANIVLPPPFVGSGAVKTGASQAAFTVHAPNATFGPLQITDLVLTRYNGVTSATGSLVLYNGPAAAATFAFSPGGALTSATADADFSPPVPIGPLVALDGIHAGFQASPFAFVGSGAFGTTARLLGAPVIAGTGCLMFGAINPGQSLNGCAAGGATPFTAAPATVMRVSGSASLLGRIALGDAFVDVSTASGVAFGGSVDYGFPPGAAIVSVSGTIAGHIANPSLWQVKAGLDGCIKHVKCTGVDALVSSRGIVACASFFWGDPGGYYRWTGGWGLMMHGCDVDSTGGVAVQAAEGRSVLARAGGSAGVRLAGGRRFEVIAVAGDGASPRITLDGPGGVHVVDNGQPFQQHGRAAAIFHLEEDGVPPSPDGSYVPGTTYVYVIRPRAGVWHVTAQSGSSAIVGIRTARALPAVRVRARISRVHGRRFALTYDARVLRGQRIRFVEVGRRPLSHAIGAATASGHGTIIFDAALGPAGTRTVEAQVEQDGLPRTVVRVATFISPRLVLPAPAVRVRRSGRVLLVRWRTVVDATSYAVDVRLSDGRHLRLLPPRGTISLTVPGVRRTVAARITIEARAGGLSGPARRVLVPAVARPAPVVL